MTMSKNYLQIKTEVTKNKNYFFLSIRTQSGKCMTNGNNFRV